MSGTIFESAWVVASLAVLGLGVVLCAVGAISYKKRGLVPGFLLVFFGSIAAVVSIGLQSHAMGYL